jgi:hypothetical protein
VRPSGYLLKGFYSPNGDLTSDNVQNYILKKRFPGRHLWQILDFVEIGIGNTTV